MSDKINPEAAMDMAETLRQFGNDSAKNLGHFTNAVVKALGHKMKCSGTITEYGEKRTGEFRDARRVPCPECEEARKLLPEEKESHEST